MEALTPFRKTQVVVQEVVQEQVVQEQVAQAVPVDPVVEPWAVRRLQNVLAQVDVLLVKYPIVRVLLDSVNDVQATEPQVDPVAQVDPVDPVAEAVIVEPPVVAQVVKTMPHRETPSALVTILVAHHLASVVKLLQALDLQTLIPVTGQLFKRVKQTPTQILRTIVKRLITRPIIITLLLHRLQQVPVVLHRPHLLLQQVEQHLVLLEGVAHLLQPQQVHQHHVPQHLDLLLRQRPVQPHPELRLR
jgi:hypothetical protein